MNNDLYHHGILGMKWGIRRFQRKDGTLTPAGKKRRAESGEPEREETIEERRARVLKSVDAREIYKNKDILTTNEINERINRIDTEERLKSKIADDHKQTGKEYINSKTKSAAEVINNAKNLFKSIDDAYSAVTGSSIGKALSEALGLKPPKAEFDLDDFWENRNKKSNQEMSDVNKRLINENLIRKEVERRNKETQRKTEAEKKEAERRAKAEHQAEESKKENKQTGRTETVHGTVEGVGTSHHKYESWKNSGKEYIDVEFTDVSSSSPSYDNYRSYGQDLVIGLLEEKHRR